MSIFSHDIMQQLGGAFRGRSTWAARPVTDINLGDILQLTDVVPGSLWRWDGADWLPLSGRQTLHWRGPGDEGTSISSPLEGDGTTQYFAPNPSLSIPAGMLIPGKTGVEVQTAFMRTGPDAGMVVISLTDAPNAQGGSGNNFGLTGITFSDDFVHGMALLYVAAARKALHTEPNRWYSDMGVSASYQAAYGQFPASDFVNTTAYINASIDATFTSDTSVAWMLARVTLVSA